MAMDRARMVHLRHNLCINLQRGEHSSSKTGSRVLHRTCGGHEHQGSRHGDGRRHDGPLPAQSVGHPAGWQDDRKADHGHARKHEACGARQMAAVSAASFGLVGPFVPAGRTTGPISAAIWRVASFKVLSARMWQHKRQ